MLYFFIFFIMMGAVYTQQFSGSGLIVVGLRQGVADRIDLCFGLQFFIEYGLSYVKPSPETGHRAYLNA
jgi:hypothetical protein